MGFFVNRIHRKLEYALIALKHMSQKAPGDLTTVKEICQTYKVPFDATARVLQILVQNKVLKSEQGAHGGYSILKDLVQLNLLELIQVVVGPVEVVKCLSESESQASPCEIQGQCNIMMPLIDLNHQLIQFYKGINVEKLLNTSVNPLPELGQDVSARVGG